MNDVINLFISYAHNDAEYLKRIKEYVKDEMCPGLKVWDDKSISPGAKWDNEIKRKIHDADIILLMVSISFLNSAYINEVELRYALEKGKSNQCTIIPIFVRTCPLNKPVDKEITGFQGYPRDNEKKRRFLNEMENDIDTHLTDLYNGVLDAADAIKKKREIENAKPLPGDTTGQHAVIEKLRSNNKIFLSLPVSESGLKMRKQFFYAAKGKKEYENWPFEIVPDIKQVQSVEDIHHFPKQSALQHINESIYTIHIITSPEEISTGSVKEQLEYAMGRNTTELFSRSIIWLLSSKLMESLDKVFMTCPVVAGMDIEEIFKIIDGFEVERSQILKLEEDSFFTPNLKALMIYDFSKDHYNQFRKVIKGQIENKKRCSIRLSTPEHTVEALKQDLNKCEGAIIIYGGSEAPWYLYRQALLFDAQSLKSKAVCVCNPNIDGKIDFDISLNEFILIREDAGLQKVQNGLDNFLDKLSA